MEINDLVHKTLDSIKEFKEECLENHILMHFISIMESERLPGKILGLNAVVFLDRRYIYSEHYLKGLKLKLNAYDYNITLCKSRIKVMFYIPIV